MTEIETVLLRDRKAKVQQYFAMWVTRDFEALPRIFAVDCYYQECYGPAYLSLAEVQAWIEHQLRVQRVTAWSIQRLWSATDNMIFAQWSFTAVTDRMTQFDGLSAVHFNLAGRIDDLREYQTTTAHDYPYHGSVL